MPRSSNPVPQYFTAKNKILVGGLMFYFEAGTSDPKATFSDQAETIQNTHPVVLDSEGRLPNVFFTGTAKQVLEDANNVQIWERDNVGDSDTPNFNDADLQFFSTTQNMIVEFNKTPTINDIVETLGFDLEGDGGGAQWRFDGLTGQTPSQTPTQLSDNLLNDLNGNQWALVLGQVSDFSGTQWYPLPFGGAGNGGYLYSTIGWEKVADLINDLSQAYEFSTVALYKAFTTAFPVGKTIKLLDRGAEFTVIAGTGTANGRAIIASTSVNQSIDLIVNDEVIISHFGDITDHQVLQDAANKASEMGVASSSVVNLVARNGTFIIDAAQGSSTFPALKLKNFTRLTGGGTFKAKDNSYTTGNPPLIGNDQSANGATEIYIDGITVDANATNNVSTSAGAISILFGRPVGPSGGPGEQGVFKGAIKNIEFIDTSFIAAQVKDNSSQIIISNIINNGGHYTVQASNSRQVDISTILSANTVNNAVDVFGNNGDKFNLSGKTGTYTRGETVTGGTSGATARLLEDNGDSIQMDTIVGTFTTIETLTGGASGATATFDSKEFTKGNFSGSIRGVHVNGCLTGVFLESVSDVTVSDCNIRSATGNGMIINRINSITSGNRVTNFTVENCASAGVFFSGEVTENHVEITVDGATDGIRFNGSSFNSASDCKIKNVTNGYILTGTGNKNIIEAGVVNGATTGVNVAAGQAATTIEKPLFIATTTRLVDTASDTRYISKEDGNVVDVSGASNITPNLDAGSVFATLSTTISTPISINVPGGAKAKGQRLTLILKQDGTGGNAVTFNAIFKIKTAASTAANRRSHYEFLWTGVFFESISEVIDF